MAKILVVDDDIPLAEMIKDWLVGEDFIVETSNNGGHTQDLLDKYEYDLVVLDWDLPEVSGLDILQKLRDDGRNTPVLMLTGKDQVWDKEKGLDSGADDYLTKPFSMKEMTARIRALLRRINTNYSGMLLAGCICLDPTRHRVTVRGEEVSLLPKEFALLEYLLRHPGQVFCSDALIDRVWTAESNVGPETVRQCVKRLRQKIDVEGKESVIENVYKVGYRIRTDGE
jgi:DNA-binding response OmpR family regulator